MENKVSVLMSVYDTPTEYLEEAVNSILTQTYTSLEFIIINDNPGNDSIKEYLDEIAGKDERVRVFSNKDNIGLTKSLNIGLKHCTGKYIARMDSDDISMPNRLEKQVAYLEENTEVCLVGSSIKYFGNKSSEYDGSKVFEIIDDEDLYEVRSLIHHSGPPHPTFMFRKSFLDDKKIVYPEQIVNAQDYGIMVECLKNGGKIRRIKECLLMYREHEGQITAKRSDKQKYYQAMVSRDYLKFRFPILDEEEIREVSLIWDYYAPGSMKVLKNALEKIYIYNMEHGYFNQSILEREFNKEYSFKYRKKLKKEVRYRINYFINKIAFPLSKLVPDKIYLAHRYKKLMGRKLNITSPRLFDEKMQWLKLYDRNPLYTTLADKAEVKKYVADRIGEEYIIPTLGVWEKFNDIDFDSLPNQFVLKCTHDSASVVIVKDKDSFDRKNADEKLTKSLKTNYYWYSREWVYKNIKPRIIAEKFMVDESGTELKDYKVYCFNGKPHLIQVDFGRFTHHERNLYDTEWNYIDKQIEYPKNPNVIIQKPSNLDKMLVLAEKLADGIPSVRIDFYSIDDRLYFGEITFYQEAGFAHFDPEEYEYELGEMIHL